MTTQFVEMYHPLIASTITSPVRVSSQAADDHAAQGWLLVDPNGTLPDPVTPYYTKGAADSRYVRDTELDAQSAALVTAGTGALPVALRAAFGRAAPVLSDFIYETGTSNLLSYKEDGITIVLTYNADGTVATSKRGAEPTQTFTYSGGNLAGVA